MAKWNLISLNKHTIVVRVNAPEWWSNNLMKQAMKAANAALPNETCGFLLLSAGQWSIHVLDAKADPISCLADADEVIRFAYHQAQRDQQIFATFHTHPQGQVGFSQRDAMLEDWANLHLILVRARFFVWRDIWYHTEFMHH